MSRVIDQAGQPRSLEILLVDIDLIRPTEEINQDFVAMLTAGMRASGVWTHPLLVDAATFAILDGHHRFEAARRLGLRTVPAVCVSYDDPGIHLESWRSGQHFTPAEILRRAKSGELLPYKSTRHVTEFVLPQLRVPFSELNDQDAHGRSVASAGHHPTRGMMLLPTYNRLCFRLRIRPEAAGNLEVETAETQAPHAQLRRSLQADPAMAALLPVAPGRLVLGSSQDSPFFLTRTGLLRLPAALLTDPAALAIATRWGLEASYLQSTALLKCEVVVGIVLHGKSLLRAASTSTCDSLLDLLPPHIAAELRDDTAKVPSEALLHWQQSRIEALADGPRNYERRDRRLAELWNSVERLLVSGGDSRITVDRHAGFNRYATLPRPRPEAVHFSSSTASCISDYGFMYSELLRRDLLAAMLRENLRPQKMRERVVDAIGAELLDLFALSEDDADVVLAPSGTDTELLAVMVGLAGGGALCNILLAPEETGRGVLDAGAGRYFDSVASSGNPVPKRTPAWPAAAIRAVEVPIRTAEATPRPPASVSAEIQDCIAAALARGERIILHLLASSKTGLCYPSAQDMVDLTKLAPDSIDVVVDACQLRTTFSEVRDWVQRGWMVQLTGSKFLTGPAFSGALIVPRRFRGRIAEVARLIAEAPEVGSPQDWGRAWREQMAIPDTAPPASFGPLFRWLPALLEAHLYNMIPAPLRRYSFDRFRDALNRRLDGSRWLVRMPALEQADPAPNDQPNLATTSIICFSVMVNHWDGTQRALSESECRRLFLLLNIDISNDLGQLTAAQRALARVQAHIGQPIFLKGDGQSVGKAALRMVLGARFFGIVAHAGPGSLEAALESEIADAFRALEKLELLAQLWSKVQHVELRSRPRL